MEEGWERPPRLQLKLDELNRLIEPAFPGRVIDSFEVLATGLANTNVRFCLQGDRAAYVLRLHTRDPSAAGRESALMRYLAAHPLPSIPVAPLLYSDPRPERGPPYSIWAFVQGALFQDLFRTLPVSELVEIASVCGRALAALAAHHFLRCGELSETLEVIEEYGPPSRFVPQAVHRALFEGRAGERLGTALRDTLWHVVEQTSPRLQAIDGRYTLVHADYKRSNLLLQRSGSTWSVAAILDWEFACAGPPLIDVGLFLRAGEALPSGFRDAFASGYRDAGGELPNDWLPLSRLIDLVSQVTFLDSAHDRPRVFAETMNVVEETVRLLQGDC